MPHRTKKKRKKAFAVEQIRRKIAIRKRRKAKAKRIANAETKKK